MKEFPDRLTHITRKHYGVYTTENGLQIEVVTVAQYVTAVTCETAPEGVEYLEGYHWETHLGQTVVPDCSHAEEPYHCMYVLGESGQSIEIRRKTP